MLSIMVVLVYALFLALVDAKIVQLSDKNAPMKSVNIGPRINESMITTFRPWSSLTDNEQSGIVQLEAFFGVPLEKSIQLLPESGEVHPIPWPSNYWPSWKDGINARTTGGRSPSEKYALAFGLNLKTFTDAVSASTGVDRYALDPTTTCRKCNSDADCADEELKCARRYITEQGVCIQSWIGICHAWVAAAIFESEPKCPIVYNGIQFNSLDIKALLSQIYDESTGDVLFLGGRCNQRHPDINYYGEYKLDDCKDTTADMFHIVTSNLIGKMKRSFIADVDAKAEVWNQPMRGYKVLEERPINPAEVGMYFRSSPFTNPNARLYYVKTQLQYIKEAYESTDILGVTRSDGRPEIDQYTVTKIYEYILETDENDMIAGGEWVENSKQDHFDFMWFPKAAPPMNSTALGGLLRYENVKELLDQSNSVDC